MEKFTDFNQAAESLLGLEQESLGQEANVIAMVKSYADDGKAFEAFILAVYCLQKKFVSELIPLTEQIASYKRVKQHYRAEEYNELIEQYKKDGNTDGLYEAALIQFLVFPSKQGTWRMLNMSEAATADVNDEQHAFLQKISHFCSKIENWHKRVFESIIDPLASPITKFELKCIDYFARILSEADQKNELLSAYWCYSYLENHEASEVLLHHLGNHQITDIDGQFDACFRWPLIPVEQIKSKYITAFKLRNDVKKQKEWEHFVKLSFSDKGIVSLLPFILCSKSRGDIEMEAFALWFAIKRDSSFGLIKRMSEITGFTVSLQFLKLPLEGRGNWVNNRHSDLRKMVHQEKMEHSLVMSVKNVYTVRPFEPQTLHGLMKITSLSRDEEAEIMLRCSIERITMEGTLMKLLGYAVSNKSGIAVEIIINRMFMLGFYDAVVETVVFQSRFMSQNKLTEIKLLNHILYLYGKFVSMSDFRIDSLRIARMNLQKFDAGMAKTYHLINQEMLDDERSAFNLLQRRKYQMVVDLLKVEKSYSLVILEIIMKAAILSRKTANVILAYNRLKEADQGRASYYNLEAEQYFVKHNKDAFKRVSATPRGLVSKVWEWPAVLENPADKMASKNR